MGLQLDRFDLTADEARQRFEWARRRGHPTWLWPDVTLDAWRAALDGIEIAIRGAMLGDAAPPVLDGDCEALGVAGYTSGTGPLLGYWVEQGLIPASTEVTDVLKLHLQHNRLRMARLKRETEAVTRALAERGIAATVLKGMHSAHAYFPEPGTRPVSDIDLLIRPSDEKEAGKLLQSAGYQAGKRGRWPPQRTWLRPEIRREPHSLCFVHADDPWSIDLQTSLNRRYSVGAPMMRFDEAIGLIAERDKTFPAAMVLGQPLLALQLAVHASCGLEALSLMRLTELAFVVRRDFASGALSWAEFLAAARRIGATGLIHTPLRLCNELVPGTIPANVLAACAREVPANVRAIVDGLAPANAQRVERCSMAERFMWSGSRAGVARHVVLDLLHPGTSSPAAILAIYRNRAWRLVRGSLTY